MSNRRVLQIISGFQLGGAECIAVTLARYLKKYNLDVSIASVLKCKSDFSDSLKDEVMNCGIRTYEFGTNNTKGVFLSAFQLAKLIIKERPDIVHSHTDIPDFTLSIALRLVPQKCWPEKIVRTIHSTALWPNRFFIAKFTERIYIDDYIVHISQATSKAYADLRNRCNLQVSKNQQLIYNGVSISSFRKLETKFDTDVSKLNFCFAGRFEFSKGFNELISVIDNLRKSYCNRISFYLIGEGDLNAKLVSYKFDNNYVKILPPVVNLKAYLGEFDYVIVPSHIEGLCLLCIEASMAHTPTIISNASGLTETLPPDWPLKVNIGDVEGLSSLIEDIVSGQYDRNFLADKAIFYVAEKFKLDTMLCKYAELYNINL